VQLFRPQQLADTDSPADALIAHYADLRRLDVTPIVY
jgi:hypothetical protein